MSKYMLGILLAALAPAVWLWAAEKPDSPEDTAKRYAELLGAFTSPQVSALRLDGSGAWSDKYAKKPDHPAFHKWPMLETKVLKDALVYTSVSKLLKDPHTFNNSWAKCFMPGLGLIIEEDGKRLDLVFCLHCQYAEYHHGNESHRWPLSDEANQAFLRIYYDLFPKPEKSQKAEGEDGAEKEDGP